MQVRVFEATDMTSGLKRIREELGPDALILSTRTIRTGPLGLLGKPIVEITAAIDTAWPGNNATSQAPAALTTTAARPARPENVPVAYNAAPRPAETPTQTVGTAASTKAAVKPEATGFQYTVGGEADDLSYDDLLPAAPAPVSRKKSSRKKNSAVLPVTAAEPPAAPVKACVSQEPPPPAPPAATATLPLENQQLHNEVAELKNLIQKMAGELARLSTATVSEPALQGRCRKAAPPAAPEPAAPAAALHAFLQNCGIEPATAATIASFAARQLSADELADISRCREYLITALHNLLEVQPPDFSSPSGQQRIALLGPTGVGKTTTLAKLAAHYLSRYNRPVALITIDTYRIAAVEQLKVYGEIMHLPVEIVLSPEQLAQALQRHKDAGLVLIDTAGRSPRDQEAVTEMSTFFQENLDIEKHLVLSAATREQELLHTMQAFAPLGIDRTIFTKIDECGNHGVLLNVQVHNHAPLSFLTNGQRVPEDLLEITKHSVAELILAQPQGSSHD